MSDEEGPKPKKPEFRVVDKRISAREDTPAAQPTPEAPAKPAEAEPSPPPSAPEPPAAAAAPPPTEQPAPPPAGPRDQVWTPEQEAEAQAFVQEIAQRPSLEWVV